MSNAAHGETGAPGPEHAHPRAGEYLRIATVLAVLTAVEVAVFYIPAARGLLVPALLILSAIKFTLVVLFYMHLKFDSPVFSWLFVLGLAIAVTLLISLLLLFGAWQRFHLPR